MSFIRFRDLAFAPDPDCDSLLVGWPVSAIPIRYWTLSPTPIDILEKAVLGLIVAGHNEFIDVNRLLGLPEATLPMLARTIRSLQAKGLVDDNHSVTKEGLRALEEEQAHLKAFRQGWILFDHVRGGMFPVVQPGRLRFFRESQIHDYFPRKFPVIHERPDWARLRRESELAVAAHNKHLSLLEILDGHNDDANDNVERELDFLVTQDMSFDRIDDVELLPIGLIERHELIVEVVATMVPGEERPMLHSYSPFSQWEQDDYLDRIQRANTDQFRAALSDLRSRAKARLGDPMFGDLVRSADLQTDQLLADIRRTLGEDIGIPEEILDKLIECERYYIVACPGTDEPSRYKRETVASAWGLLLEMSLWRIASDIDECLMLAAWRHTKHKSRPAAWDWYLNLTRSAHRNANWRELPTGLKSNLQNIIYRALPTTFGNIGSSSSRDQLAKIMLAALAAASPSNLSPPVANLTTALDRGALPLKDIDAVVDCRNDAAHGGKKINQATEEYFIETVSMMRETVYVVIKHVFRND